MRARRVLIGLLLPICIVLTAAAGCAKKAAWEKEPFEGHTGNYSAVVRIKSHEMEAMALILQETPSSCSVEFELPESLRGMTFVFRNDTVDLSYKGLDFQFEPDSLPQGAAAKLMVSAISRAMRGGDEITVQGEEGILRLSGMMESGEFSLELDRESGEPVKLSIPGEELEIEFSKFRFLD